MSVLLLMAVLWTVAGIIIFSDDLGIPLKLRVRKQVPVLAAPDKNLSPPAKRVYKEYMKLPVESRPFPDIISVLEGLDKATSYDTDKRIDHYDENAHMYRYCIRTGSTPDRARKLFEYKFTWKPSRGRNCSQCSTGSYTRRPAACEFITYYTMYLEIKQILEDLAEREKKQLKADNAHHLDMARELTDRLRSEREITQQVTKELT